MTHGDKIYVLSSIGGTMAPIAAAKTCDIDINQEFIKVCAPTDGRTYRKKPTTYDWGVSCDCLMANSEYAKLLLDAERNGTEFTLKIIVNGFNVSGKAYVKSCHITAAKLSLAKLSVSFEGSGPLDDDNSWDFIDGVLHTYSNFSDGTLNMGGTIVEGTLQPSES